MAVVQSTYSETMPEAVAGMIADMRTWDGITRTCETVAGIGFGLAVGRGTDDHGCILGGTLVKFLGVSTKDITLEVSQVDKYAQYQNTGILTEGTIWVQYSSTTPTPSDPVHFSASTGIFAITGGSGPVRGARWMRTGANDLAMLNLSNNQAA